MKVPGARSQVLHDVRILALGAAAMVGGGGIGNAAPAGNDDRARLLEWQASCAARLQAAAREADVVEPGFSAAATFRTGLSPPYPNTPGVHLVYATPRGKDFRSFTADIALDFIHPLKETGWRLEGRPSHGPLPADGEGAPEAELRNLYATRDAASGVFITMSAYKEDGDRARRLYRIFRAALDDCATMMPPEVAARIIPRGGAPPPPETESLPPPGSAGPPPPLAIVIVHADPKPHRKGEPKHVKMRIVNQSKKPVTLFLNSGDPFGPGAFSVALDDSDWLPIEVEHSHEGKLITRRLAPGKDYVLSLGPDLQFRGHDVKVRYLTGDDHRALCKACWLGTVTSPAFAVPGERL